MDDQTDALQAQARTRIGQVLREKWRLDALLGVGGMAAVFAATHVNNGRRAAIKLLHAELSANADVRTRFLREGYVANKVEHPGAVGVLDDEVCEDGTVFLVMELLEGETLEDRREHRGALPAPEVLSLADRLLDVLATAHDKGIVHRDIKPENIFLTRDGSVKVLDFGIARMRELQTVRLTLTSAGAIGTPAFMPPEQARGRWDDVGPRTDLWAVGATMFTLISGRLVHQAETVNELMLAAMTKAAPLVGSVVPNLPAPVAEVIDRALAYDFTLRWPDARAMQTALRAAYPSFDRGASGVGPSGAVQAHPGPAPLLGRGFGSGGPTAGRARPSALVASLELELRPQTPDPRWGPRPQPPDPRWGLRPQTPGRATGQSVTVIGGRRVIQGSARGRLPVLPVVGGLLGALVMGAIVLFAVTRQHRPAPDTAASASASASASAAPEAAASEMPSASATATVSASASVSARPAAVAPGTTAPAPKPVPVPAPAPSKPRPGSAWPKPRR